MRDSFVGTAKALPEEQESISSKFLREGALLGAGATGIIDAGVQAFDKDHVWGTACKTAVGVGMGLVMARYAPGRGVGSALLRSGGAAMGLSMAYETAVHGSAMTNAIADNWKSDQNWHQNVSTMKRSMGTFAFDTALMTTAGVAGCALELKGSQFAMRFGQPKITLSEAALGGRSRAATAALLEGSVPLNQQTRAAAISEVGKTKGPMPHELPQSLMQPASTAELSAGTESLHTLGKFDEWRGADGAQYQIKHISPKDTKWRAIYESAFPACEQQPYEFFEKLSEPGQMPHVRMQRTDRNGQAVAFSMTSDYGVGPDGQQLLMPYIAVQKGLQSQGIGSSHLKAMLAEAKQNYPTAKGMVLEMEDPHGAGFDPATSADRFRRAEFWERNGGRVLDRKYVILNADDNLPPIPGKLVWLDFGRGGPTEAGLTSTIAAIYRHGYEVPPDHWVFKDIVGE